CRGDRNVRRSLLFGQCFVSYYLLVSQSLISSSPSVGQGFVRKGLGIVGCFLSVRESLLSLGQLGRQFSHALLTNLFSLVLGLLISQRLLGVGQIFLGLVQLRLQVRVRRAARWRSSLELGHQFGDSLLEVNIHLRVFLKRELHHCGNPVDLRRTLWSATSKPVSESSFFDLVKGHVASL